MRLRRYAAAAAPPGEPGPPRLDPVPQSSRLSLKLASSPALLAYKRIDPVVLEAGQPIRGCGIMSGSQAPRLFTEESGQLPVGADAAFVQGAARCFRESDRQPEQVRFASASVFGVRVLALW